MSSSESEIISCLICRQNISSDDPKITVKEKGLKTLKEISLKKNDHVRRSLTADVKQKTFHVACYNSYRHPHSVKATESTKSTPNKSEKRLSDSLRSSKSKFNFEELCLFCGERAPDDQKKKNTDRRIQIRHVTVQSTGTYKNL